MKIKVYMHSSKRSAANAIYEKADSMGLRILRYRTFYKFFEGYGAEAICEEQ